MHSCVNLVGGKKSISLFQNKFTSLSLAFKTDKLTLVNRLELQQRQRDNAEKNVEAEIDQLKVSLNELSPFAEGTSEGRSVLKKISKQVRLIN